MLDDASSSLYMNKEVAEALGLVVPYEPVTVPVLNNAVETFDAMLVNVILESDDGTKNIPFSAYTCPRQITGNYRVVDNLDGRIYEYAIFQNQRKIVSLTF